MSQQKKNSHGQCYALNTLVSRGMLALIGIIVVSPKFAFAATCPDSEEIHLQVIDQKQPRHYVTDSGWISTETTLKSGANLRFDRVLMGFSQNENGVLSGDVHACMYELDGGDTPFNSIHMTAPVSSPASINNVSEWLDISIPEPMDVPPGTFYTCPSSRINPTVLNCEFTIENRKT